MTSDEWRDTMIMVDAMSDSELSERLEELAKYELTLLDAVDPVRKELRDILLFRTAIFLAAGTRLKELTNPESSG